LHPRGAGACASPRLSEQNQEKHPMAIVEVKVPQLSESVAEATCCLEEEGRRGRRRRRNPDRNRNRQGRARSAAPAAGVLAEIVQGDGATVVADQ
jgi:2-oxoglutarate dehydrogenase E2 component (dihydrolipoamide succinyltransferase)